PETTAREERNAPSSAGCFLENVVSQRYVPHISDTPAHCSHSASTAFARGGTLGCTIEARLTDIKIRPTRRPVFLCRRRVMSEDACRPQRAACDRLHRHPVDRARKLRNRSNHAWCDASPL